MRFYEFHPEDNLALILRNIIGTYSRKKKAADINLDAINQYLQSAKKEPIDILTLQKISDLDPVIQNLIKDIDVDNKIIKLKVPGVKDAQNATRDPEQSRDEVNRIASANAEKQIQQ